MDQQFQHCKYALPQARIPTGPPPKGATKIFNRAMLRLTFPHSLQGLRRVASNLCAPTLNQTTANQIDQHFLVLRW
ncbi:MAG: hypothetical protein H5T62_15400 [Anaerolineae bacterium]|nr:hypothetical protein [Anaerolineae bacterium]